MKAGAPSSGGGAASPDTVAHPEVHPVARRPDPWTAAGSWLPDQCEDGAWSRRFRWLGATVIVVAALFILPNRCNIAPLVEADNAYIFLAADRIYSGEGPTSLPPMAPFQPWEWRCDWTFLTNWPVGYPVLICAARLVLGASTVAAAVSLGILCSGIALVAWFAWIRKSLPPQLPRSLIALVGAGSSFSVDGLVNPSSDTVLLASAPLVMLLTVRALRQSEAGRGSWRPRLMWLAAAGLSAGVLCWIRYAAVFMPLAVGLFLAVEWAVMRRARFGHLAVYGASALLPIAGLLAINRTFGQGVSTQELLNLGHRVSFDFRPEMLATAWSHFTEQTLYGHRPEAEWFFRLVLPLTAVTLPLAWKSSRRVMKSFMRSPPILLSVASVATCVTVLICASVVFQGKYDYVSLPRYYDPVKPLYFLLFVGPVMTLGQRWIRALACVPLIMAGSWFINQDGVRTYTRLLAADRPTTAYGRWARRFEPNSRALYGWLASQGGNDLIIFSNFHDDVALETGLPASPVPPDAERMSAWLDRIRRARQIDRVRALFVLDPDNDVRDYFLTPPAEIIARFDLVRPADVPSTIAQYVYRTSGEDSEAARDSRESPKEVRPIISSPSRRPQPAVPRPDRAGP